MTTIHHLSTSLFGTQMFRLRRILFIDVQPDSTAASTDRNQPKTFRRQEPPHLPPQGCWAASHKALRRESRTRPGPGPPCLHGLRGCDLLSSCQHPVFPLISAGRCLLSCPSSAASTPGGQGGSRSPKAPPSLRWAPRAQPEGCVVEPVCEGHGAGSLKGPGPKP